MALFRADFLLEGMGSAKWEGVLTSGVAFMHEEFHGNMQDMITRIHIASTVEPLNEDTFGPAVLSFVERLSSFRGDFL